MSRADWMGFDETAYYEFSEREMQAFLLSQRRLALYPGRLPWPVGMDEWNRLWGLA